jgi:hypothetical protein
VIRNYEGKIFEYPEQEVPATAFRSPEHVDEFLYS